jgi:hypothetical protein
VNDIEVEGLWGEGRLLLLKIWPWRSSRVSCALGLSAFGGCCCGDGAVVLLSKALEEAVVGRERKARLVERLMIVFGKSVHDSVDAL